MRARIRELLFALVLLTRLTGHVNAATFSLLHAFSALDADTHTTNSDGANPVAGLVLSNNILYGTAEYGGTYGDGTVFALATNGALSVLHTFTARAAAAGTTNDDGFNPESGLILSGNFLYGATETGGTNGDGTSFAINTNGTGFAVLHNFGGGNTDGEQPYSELVAANTILYGTTYGGGSNDDGTVFAISTNGAGFTLLHSFNYESDGANPQAGLVLSGSMLYGTAQEGGSNYSGTIFAINTNGTGFTVLHAFDYSVDGGYPVSGLVLSGNTLYGTAAQGGSNYSGTIFAINTNGAGFTLLHTLAGNADGNNPVAGLTLSGNVLYGTADSGGSAGWGTVFALNTDGTDFTVLYNFTNGTDGGNPQADLVLSGNTLYGTAEAGGSNDEGTVFGIVLSPAPVLSMPESVSNGHFQMTVTGTGGQSCTIQTCTNLLSKNWVSLLMTNPPSGTFIFNDPNATNQQRFYRAVIAP